MKTGISHGDYTSPEVKVITLKTCRALLQASSGNTEQYNYYEDGTSDWY